MDPILLMAPIRSNYKRVKGVGWAWGMFWFCFKIILLYRGRMKSKWWRTMTSLNIFCRLVTWSACFMLMVLSLVDLVSLMTVSRHLSDRLENVVILLNGPVKHLFFKVMMIHRIFVSCKLTNVYLRLLLDVPELVVSLLQAMARSGCTSIVMLHNS